MLFLQYKLREQLLRGEREAVMSPLAHLLVTTPQPLKYDLQMLAATVPPFGFSIGQEALFTPTMGASDKHVSMPGNDFQLLDGCVCLEKNCKQSFLPSQAQSEQTGPLPRPQPIPSVGPEGETFPHPGKEESHLPEFWE